MKIEKSMPRFDVMACYETTVRAPVERAYAVARHLDMRESTAIRLRGMPTPSLTLDGMLDTSFILLADDVGREIVLGLVGRFWTLTGYLESVDSNGFAAFHQAGIAKAVVNIAFSPLSETNCQVTTQTQVVCCDVTSRHRFRFYWMLI